MKSNSPNFLLPSPQQPHAADNVGIVRGVPKPPNAPLSTAEPNPFVASFAFSSPPPPHPVLPTNAVEFNSADIRSSLDRKTNNRSPPHESDSDSAASGHITFPGSADQLYAQGPPISSNGALVPPPYRDPPPPASSAASSPLLMANNPSVAEALHRFDTTGLNTFVQVHDLAEPNAEAVTFQNAQYRELIQLIKYQREKLSSQKADLSKFDAEIVYLENKEREQLQHIDAITREISKTDQMFRQGQEQVTFIQR